MATNVSGIWAPRRLLTALAGTVGTALVIGVPTVVIPNPAFGREVPVTWWSYPVLGVVSVLSGLLLATYVRDGQRPAMPVDDRAPRRGIGAGVLTFFAVGCPICNKVVLVALGTSGALNWFAPLQPLLALASIAALAWALRTRLAGLRACPVGTASTAGTAGS